MSDDTTFLFPTPTFWEGMARIVDFGDTLTAYNRSANGKQADTKALRADWRAVGHDIRIALDRVAEEADVQETTTQPRR